MNNIFLYPIQVALIFSILYLLYVLFLDKLTFHKTNRLVLLLLLPASIIIPVLGDLFPSITSKMIEVPLFEHLELGVFNKQLEAEEQPLKESSFNYNIILIVLYWLMFSVFIVRISITTMRLFLLRRKSVIQQNKDYKLVIADVPEIFSYFNWIFIPKSKLEQYDKQVIEHERAHIQLKHSWDVILTEIYIAFFWFNPLLYFYRKSLKSIHEFQADNGVLKNGVKTSHYMQLLLQSLETSKPNSLYNYFNQPILKKRITMMTKPESNHFSKLKYILFLPVCAFLVSAFESPNIEDYEYLNILNVSEFISRQPSMFPVQNGTKKDITSHFGEKAKRPKTKKGTTHNGIDIRAKIGTPVIATADGIIVKASMKDDWGNLIVLAHADGYETWYAHLNGFNVNEKQEVKKGDVIGYVGNTGLSTGPHLHYEVKQYGKHLNPLDYLE